MKVPYLDLGAHHAPHRAEYLRAIEEVIDRGAFAGGVYVEEFEKQFADYCEADFAIGVGSGTEALWLPLLAMGIGLGDEVITVPNSFFATAEAISYTGATPVFVDIEESSYNMDPAGLEAALTPRTKAIIPVHLFGQPADMEPILDFARRHGLRVVEDAAQAHGAEYRGRRTGSLGDAAGFSFYPGKNLGAFGEGGAITTSDPELAQRMRMLRDHGQDQKHSHAMVGWNCRMDGIQAAVLQIKLARLDGCNDLRRQRAAEYDRAFREMEEVVAPAGHEDRSHVYHIYPIRVRQRDRVMGGLAERGIGCAIHYPVPIHRQGAYEHLGLEEGTFPVAERCAREFVSLPMFPELRSEQVDAVVGAVRETVQTQPVS
ncbi:MAG: DegT/DnrJ/EryC1/StrS family aminotransferase [Akkermansiaceae bacterium]|nr:DegT/DnrJ/EryC1/StrS family aminotransferase [Akkermansiaceae bacterium]NNM29740.1 DegT/DnrJ/EryC1/StrS family aminotransferase [Akkermansiaceae bacterium]